MISIGCVIKTSRYDATPSPVHQRPTTRSNQTSRFTLGRGSPERRVGGDHLDDMPTTGSGCVAWGVYAATPPFAVNDAPVPKMSALPVVATPDQQGSLSAIARNGVPFAALRMLSVDVRARQLKVMPLAIVVDANEAPPLFSYVIAPVSALKACTVGCCICVSRGFVGSHTPGPVSNRPKSPMPVDP